MATEKQKAAAQKNVRKAQQAWRSMSSREHSRAQPEGRSRTKPGTTGAGNFFHVEVRPRAEFVTFRTQDIGEKGGIERVAGKRSSGSWDTQKWLIGKEHAHLENGELVADTADAQELLRTLGSTPTHVRGDRSDVPEHEKPTAAQRQARQRNITRAQAARHKS